MKKIEIQDNEIDITKSILERWLIETDNLRRDDRTAEGHAIFRIYDQL